MSQAKQFFERLQSLHIRFPKLTNREQEEVAPGNPEFQSDTWRKLLFDLETVSGRAAETLHKADYLFPDCSVLTWEPQDPTQLRYSDTGTLDAGLEQLKLRRECLEEKIQELSEIETEFSSHSPSGLAWDGVSDTIGQQKEERMDEIRSLRRTVNSSLEDVNKRIKKLTDSKA
jgi:hypothetical protein